MAKTRWLKKLTEQGQKIIELLEKIAETSQRKPPRKKGSKKTDTGVTQVLAPGTNVMLNTDIGKIKAGAFGVVQSATNSWHYVSFAELTTPLICRRHHLDVQGERSAPVSHEGAATMDAPIEEEEVTQPFLMETEEEPSHFFNDEQQAAKQHRPEL